MMRSSQFAKPTTAAEGRVVRRSLAARLAEQAGRCREDLLTIARRGGRRAERLRRLHESLATVQGRALDDWPGSARHIAQGAVYGAYCLRGTTQDKPPSGFIVPGDGPALPPLLRDYFSQLAAIGLSLDYAESPIDAHADAARLLAAHAGSDSDLYEQFLGHFDAAERGRRGVFYTPPAVAAFVVDGVDRLLRRQAERSDGSAEGPSAASLAATRDLILDPAAGSGRFLEAVIRHVHQTMTQQWRAAGANEVQSLKRWQTYVPRQLLPRVCGFELALAPYLAAHVRLAAVLRETGYVLRDADRIQVYLTDALAAAGPRAEEIRLAGFADEAGSTAHLKQEGRFRTIVGNPPYANFSANLSPAARALVGRYKQIDGRALAERNALQMERNVNDDYVKFLARAEDLLSGGEDAALGFVVNRSLLASATLRGVRARLLRTFEKIQIVDLGGDAVGGGGNGDGTVDENVFATSKGVGLLLAARSRLPTRHTGKVQYVRFRGNRNEKLAALESAWSSSPDYQTAAAAPPDYRFVVSRNATLWRRFAPIDKLFTVFAEGLKTGFDQGLIGFSAAETREKLNDLRHVSANADALRKKYKVGPRGWADRLLTHPENTSHAAAASPRIVRFAYRPLDFRYCPWPSALLKSPSTVAGRHLDARRNLCLIVTRQVAGPAEVSHFYVSRAVPDNRLLYSRRGSATYFPLYAAEAAESGERRSLLKQDEMNRFAGRLGFQWVDEGPGDLIQTLGPESFLHFTYAVLHAPTYRRSFADALRGSFPRIPPARDCEAFRASCQLGADLVALHLAEPGYAAASWNRASQSGSGRPFETWRATAGLPSSASVLIESSVGGTHDIETNRVGRGFPKYTDGRVWINPRQAIGPVDEEIWQFRIGGYQMAHKWLKDRRGRVLTATEIEAYLTLLSIQCETIRLMQRVDSIALRFQLFDESAKETSVTGSRP